MWPNGDAEPGTHGSIGNRPADATIRPTSSSAFNIDNTVAEISPVAGVRPARNLAPFAPLINRRPASTLSIPYYHTMGRQAANAPARKSSATTDRNGNYRAALYEPVGRQRLRPVSRRRDSAGGPQHLDPFTRAPSRIAPEGPPPIMPISGISRRTRAWRASRSCSPGKCQGAKT